MGFLDRFRKMERTERLSLFFGFLVIVGVLVVAIGIMATIKITPYKTYTNKRVGIEIKFPSYWKPVRSQLPGIVIAFLSPKTDTADLFQENVNVSIKRMPQAMTIEHLSNMIVSQVAGTFGDNIEITEQVGQSLGGKPGFKLSFTGYGKDLKTATQYVVAWTIVEDRAYIITFTGMAGDYPKFKGKVDTMINSFKFVPIVNPATAS